MRILVVHPGASMSTSDVYDGAVAGLRARGHEIFDYALDARIEMAGAWLTYCWRKGGKQVDRPTQSDILYRAGEELLPRALRIEPDVVLVISAMYLHPDNFVLMRKAGLKVAVLFTESPYDDEKQVKVLPYVDAAWTNERVSARQMNAIVEQFSGTYEMPTVGYLPHAWNPERHGIDKPLNPDAPAHDVVFVGTGFSERIETLEQINLEGLDVGLYGSWELLGSRNKLRQHLRGGYVDNSYASSLYRKAKVGLNLYRSSKGFGKDAPRVARAESLNPRAYELAAAGCVSISDARAEVEDIFGGLVPTFSHPEDVRPLIDRLLADEPRRREISSLLPGAVAEHTWRERAGQIEDDLYGAGIGASHTQQADAAMTAAAGG